MLKGDGHANRPHLRFGFRLPIGSHLRPGWNEGNNLLKQAPIVDHWRPTDFHLIRGADVVTDVG
jgi:hypothetical protein